MTARIDKLLNLLDTAPSPVHRLEAAHQIGHVAALESLDVGSLLNRLHVYVGSRSWETRTAAANAIRAVAQTKPGRSFLAHGFASRLQAGLLTFQSFDIERVVAHGKPLLSTGTMEYDFDVDDLDSKDRLALQRSYVLNKVGLEAEPGDIRNAFRFADLEAIITDEDLTCKPPKPLEYAPCAQSHHTQ